MSDKEREFQQGLRDVERKFDDEKEIERLQAEVERLNYDLERKSNLFTQADDAHTRLTEQLLNETDKRETTERRVEELEREVSEQQAKGVTLFAEKLEELSKDIPLGAQCKSKGASTYNWQMYFKSVAENFAEQLRANGGGK